MNEQPKLVDPQGKEIKRVRIPVVKVGDFIFPMHPVEESELAPLDEKGVRPSDIIRELRATRREFRHRFTLLAAGLTTILQEEGLETPKLKNFIENIGLVVRDADQKVFYQPGPEDEFVKEELTPEKVADSPV